MSTVAVVVLMFGGVFRRLCRRLSARHALLDATAGSDSHFCGQGNGREGREGRGGGARADELRRRSATVGREKV